MTPLDNRIDEDFVARYYRGEAIVLEGQLEDVDGAVEQLDGLTFFATIMLPNGDDLHRLPAAILRDTTGPYFQAIFDGEVSSDLYGQSALRWALGQYVEGRGNQVIVEGPLILRPGPVARAVSGAQGAAAIAHRFVRRLTTTGRSTVRISNMGPRGLSPWEAEGKTREQYQADLTQLATDAGTDIALGQVGAAITELGETTSQKIAEVDDAIALSATDRAATVAATGAANTATKNANDKAAAAQGVVDAGATIIAAKDGAVTARQGSEAARDESARTAASLGFYLVGNNYAYGKRVVFGRAAGGLVGDVITDDGYHFAKYAIRVQGAAWARGADGFWTLDLSALSLGKYGLAGGGALDATSPRYYAGRKVLHAFTDNQGRAAFIVTDDGRVHVPKLTSPSIPDASTIVYSTLSFTGGETMSVQPQRYHNGKKVRRAWVDANGAASLVEYDDGTIYVAKLSAPALDLAGGTASLDAPGYVLSEIVVAGRKQLRRFGKTSGVASTITSGSNNFAPRLSADGTKVIYLSDRSGVKESWYQQLDGMKIGGSIEHPVLPRQSFCPLGDSLTAGGYADLVAQAFGVPLVTPSSVFNDGTNGTAGGGIGSQQSPQIVARYGAAADLTCSLAGNTMTAGANTLAALSIHLLTRAGDQAGSIRTLRAIILGVAGVLKSVQQADNSNGALAGGGTFYLYTFTPDAGQVLPAVVPANTRLEIDPENRQDSILLLWAGSNDVGAPGWQDRVKARISDAVTKGYKPLVRRVCILSVLNSTARPAGSSDYAEIVAFNLELAALYGDSFIDVRTPYCAGTADDTPNPAYAADGLHYNNAGKALIAQLVIDRITQKGWFNAV